MGAVEYAINKRLSEVERELDATELDIDVYEDKLSNAKDKKAVLENERNELVLELKKKGVYEEE